MHKGSCLCGSIKFKISGKIGIGEMCHCTQCRKWTGHVLASTEVPRDAISIEGEENIKWYHSSKKVRRGFCSQCGSPLFFDPIDKEKHNWISVSLGAFATPTDTTIELHIFTAEKGDYYEILDGAKQNEH
jgi:hypothetical protein